MKSILKIENDSLLLSKFIEFKINEVIEELDLEPGEDYFKYQNINDGEIIYSSDSILKVINIFGEYSGGATHNPYAENFILYSDRILNNGSGKILKLNNISKNDYHITINDYSRMGDHINTYNLTFSKDTIVLTKKSSKNKIFDLIVSKKETPQNFPDSIAYKFDFSRRFTEKEITALNLDTTKIHLNQHFFLSNQKFLKKQVDSISFLVYHKHQYGDELSKILRVKRKDTVFDLTLAVEGGDGNDHYEIETEFINDSIFVSKNTASSGDIVYSKNNGYESVYEYYYVIRTRKYLYDKMLNLKLIQADTISYTKQLTYKNRKLTNELKISRSEPFTINNIKCYWEYAYKANDSIRKTDFKLFGQKLRDFKTREILLDLDLSKFIDFFPYYWDKVDVNKDGNTDIQFTTEIAGVGANTGFASYIFDSTKKIFEYSDIFSGYNVDYDSEKNRISTFGKSAVNDYYFTIKNLKNNRREIDFIERVRHYEDTIFYEKIINGKIVEENKVVLGEYENWEQYLERK
jgi:hypothetical protein